MRYYNEIESDVATVVYKLLTEQYGYSDAGARWVAGEAGEAAMLSYRGNSRYNPFTRAPLGCVTAPSGRRVVLAAASAAWEMPIYGPAPGAVYLGSA